MLFYISLLSKGEVKIDKWQDIYPKFKVLLGDGWIFEVCLIALD